MIIEDEPSVGSEIFVQVNQFVNVWEQVPVSFWAIVPAAA